MCAYPYTLACLTTLAHMHSVKKTAYFETEAGVPSFQIAQGCVFGNALCGAGRSEWHVSFSHASGEQRQLP